MQEVTIQEAAGVLGKSAQEVWILFAEGRIRGERRYVRDRGLRERIFLDRESVEAYKKQPRKSGGWRPRDTEEVVEEMRKRGYMTAAEAAKTPEFPYTANYLSKAIRRGTIEGEIHNVVWIHRDEVARLRREREAKIEAVV